VPAGQPKGSAPSRSAAGKSATSEIPAHFLTLLIVTRKGRDYRPGARKRIEQVARRVAPLTLRFQCLPTKLQAEVFNAKKKKCACWK
jgi:hypothetical protein